MYGIGDTINFVGLTNKVFYNCKIIDVDVVDDAHTFEFTVDWAGCVMKHITPEMIEKAGNIA
jgi:hypothetical protein